jgi:hypothetical protein
MLAPPPSLQMAEEPPRGAATRKPLPMSQDMVVLKRRETELEKTLHVLLDQQSDALLAIAGNARLGDGETSTGSTTPTAHSPRSTSRSPDSRPPIRRIKPSLRTTRERIYKAIKELATVKQQEEDVTLADQDDGEQVLQQLQEWERKRTGLARKIELIQHQDIEVQKQDLQTQADKLVDAITATEQKLNRMRREHALLLNKIELIDNTVQAEISSHQSSLKILENKIQDFLSHPPLPEERSTSLSRDDTFLSLPPSRRTLEMAFDYWSNDVSGLKKQNRAMRKERTALAQGASIWKQCVKEISEFEKHLQQKMPALGSGNAREEITAILDKMHGVIESVEEKQRYAESKNWKLLIVCMGAELEAFKQGRSILLGALHAAGPEEPEDVEAEEPSDFFGDIKAEDDDDSDDEAFKTASASAIWSGKQPLQASAKSPNKIASPPAVQSPPVYDSDDGPDHDLMVSKPQDESDD